MTWPVVCVVVGAIALVLWVTVIVSDEADERARRDADYQRHLRDWRARDDRRLR